MQEASFKIPKIAIVGVSVAVLAMIISSSIQVIETGNVGVKSTLGQIDRDELSPGLNFAMPIFQKIEKVFTKTIMVNYTPEQRADSQEVYYERSLQGEDRTGLEMGIDLIVEVSPQSHMMADMYIEVGREGLLKKVLQPIRGSAREVLGRYSAESVMSKRKDVENDLNLELTELFSKNEYFTLENMQLKKIYLPTAVKKAIEKVQLSKQDANAKKEQIKANDALGKSKVALAIGEAQAKRERAQATADALLINAKAEAEAIILKSKAQAESNKLITESLSSILIQQNTIQAWKAGGAQVPTFIGSGESQFIFDINKSINAQKKRGK